MIDIILVCLVVCIIVLKFICNKMRDKAEDTEASSGGEVLANSGGGGGNETSNVSTGVVIEGNLVAGKMGKVKCGEEEIYNALIDEKSTIKQIDEGNKVVVRMFRSDNVAMVDMF